MTNTTPRTDPRILVTYEIVTPESAEQGDAEERGWIDQDGQTMAPDAEEASEGHTPVTLAYDSLYRCGASQPSCTGSGLGAWYTCDEHSTDYRTGAAESRSYHLEGFTPEQEQAIWELVQAWQRPVDPDPTDYSVGG
jgi:hypothetical protein